MVAWGDPSSGGDSSMVQDRLQGIVNVQGNPSAFAAVTEEGSLVTWGDATLGGDSSVIRSKLQQKVRQVTPSLKGFFAILEDWSLIYWGGAHQALACLRSSIS